MVEFEKVPINTYTNRGSQIYKIGGGGVMGNFIAYKFFFLPLQGRKRGGRGGGGGGGGSRTTHGN